MHHQYDGTYDRDSEESENDYIKNLKKFLARNTSNKIKDLYINSVTEHEKIIIDDMLGTMTNPLQIVHFFFGGHIKLAGDNAALYEKWSENFGPRIGTNGEAIHGARKNRISSHSSINQQYAVSGPVVKEALFGTCLVEPYNSKSPKCSWIQLESSPLGGFKEFRSAPISFLMNAILHMLNYFDYKITKRNIGPHGKSIYTEANPLTIDVSSLTPELAEKRSNLWKEIIFERMGDISGLEDRMALAGLDVPDGLSSIPTANV